MKFLVSDYDGTYKEDIKGKNIILNNEAIKNFLNKGNKFVIATGRSYTSIKKEINKYNIPYNYLICNNGSVIFNEQDEIIYKYPISEEILYETLEILTLSQKIKKIELFDAKGNLTQTNAEIIELLCQVSIKNIQEIKKIKNILNYLECISFLNTFLLKTPSNKKDGIEIIAKKEKINPNDIYTIGNDINDLEMLKAYNGYKIIYSNPKLLLKNIKTITSVKSLIKKINK